MKTNYGKKTNGPTKELCRVKTERKMEIREHEEKGKSRHIWEHVKVCGLL